VIDLKQRPDVGWNVLLAISLLGLAVAAWFAFLVPKPYALTQPDASAVLKGIEASTKEAESKSSAAQEALGARIWDVNAEVLSSQIQETVTHLCEKNHSILAAFRPGKVIPAVSLIEVPFGIVVEGGFPDLMAVLKSLDDPESKVAVSQVQIASNNGSDQVRATIAVTAFIAKPEDK